MAKKHHFIVVDTETTQDDKVADFAAVVCDRKGRVQATCAVLVDGIFTDAEKHPLFFKKGVDDSDLWSIKSRDRRRAKYNQMIADGSRMIASVAAINRWLERAKGEYNPKLTAYNLTFDTGKMDKTGIDHTIFSERFCLWHATAGYLAKTKAYKTFALEHHAFNPPTSAGNMTYKTNAEITAKFVLSDSELVEPHTALEDILGFEIPILTSLTRRLSYKQILEVSQNYNWRHFQVKDHFKATGK